MLLERRKTDEKEAEKGRLIRAAIQLVFFIFYPALFSTAFAGVKSVFSGNRGAPADYMELIS